MLTAQSVHVFPKVECSLERVWPKLTLRRPETLSGQVKVSQPQKFFIAAPVVVSFYSIIRIKLLHSNSFVVAEIIASLHDIQYSCINRSWLGYYSCSQKCVIRFEIRFMVNCCKAKLVV